MRLYFYRDKHPNFGDELNTWLLPTVFPNFFNDRDDFLFLGIGSILLDSHPKDCKKIVFGSGFGGYGRPPVLDDNWDVYCVRGPRTANALGLGPSKIAGDAAILINRYGSPRTGPRRAVGFMPHWESVDRGYWQTACRLAGIVFIDPRLPVNEVLTQMEGCATLITEAMHGAIVADALRIPWIPTLPFHGMHRLKWFDWAEALNISMRPYTLWPSSIREVLLMAKMRGSYRLGDLQGVPAKALNIADSPLTALAAARLLYLSRKEPTMSSDSALDLVLDRLETNALQIKRDFASYDR